MPTPIPPMSERVRTSLPPQRIASKEAATPKRVGKFTPKNDDFAAVEKLGGACYLPVVGVPAR